jgi:hypothetical protein
MDIQIQEAFRIPNTHNQERVFPCPTTVKMPNLQDKEKILKDVVMKYFNLKRKTYQNYLRPISRNFKSQESTE